MCISNLYSLDRQDKQRKMAEEQMSLFQQQAQAKAQMLRYDDELARKRMQVPAMNPFCLSSYFFFKGQGTNHQMRVLGS